MNLLSATDLQKAFGPKVILDNVTFGIARGEVVGLIGDNGTGKSTLMKILVGDEPEDDGIVSIRAGAKLSYLEQVPTLPAHATAREVLAAPFAKLESAISSYETAAKNGDDAADGWLDTIERLGGWDWQHRLEEAATRVGLGDLSQTIGTMSGGQAKRVALARLVLEQPDLMLLDEPTNHLDAETVEWLEGWLASCGAACILVTHDRYFLERVTSHMAELRDGQLRIYSGPYSAYLEARAEEEALDKRTGARRLKMLKTELEWARRSPKARTTKSRARLGRIDNIEADVKRLNREHTIADFAFDAAPRLGKTVLELIDVSKSLPEGAPPLIRSLSLMMRKGDRIGVLGKNGCGKTTLMRMILDELKPDGGTIRRGTQTKFAYFDQHRRVLDPDKSLRQTICPDGGDKVFVGEQAIHVASWLKRFGFHTDAHRMPVGRLSGGERNRLALARFLLTDANFLILDEPTNDLDLRTMHTLEEALIGFPGCVMVVSHDRWFLDRVATSVLAFEELPGGTREITLQDGDYTTYRRLRLARLTELKREAEARDKAQRAAAAPTRQAKSQVSTALTYAERLELEALEPEVEQLEAKLAALDLKLADGDVWQDADRALALQQERDEQAAHLAARYERWELLMEKAE